MVQKSVAPVTPKVEMKAGLKIGRHNKEGKREGTRQYVLRKQCPTECRVPQPGHVVEFT